MTSSYTFFKPLICIRPKGKKKKKKTHGYVIIVP